MGRSPCCSKEGLNRGAWTSLEDQILIAYIKAHGEGNWRNLPKRAGLKRCGKSCKLRWLNYLRPDIKRGNISGAEEDLITRLHKLLGNRWSLIAGRLPGRTDNEIKNYWNTTLAKKAKDQSSSSANPSSKHQIRCAKAVHLPEMDPLEPQESQGCGLKMDYIAHHEGNDLGFLYFDQVRGINDDVVGANNDLSSMDVHDQAVFMDKPFLEDWAANIWNLEDHDNASLDLESLASFLNSSEWP